MYALCAPQRQVSKVRLCVEINTITIIFFSFTEWIFLTSSARVQTKINEECQSMWCSNALALIVQPIHSFCDKNKSKFLELFPLRGFFTGCNIDFENSWDWNQYYTHQIFIGWGRTKLKWINLLDSWHLM